MQPKAPFRLLYNNDSTNTAGIPSPWHEDGEPFVERLLTASIAEVAGKGVDAYLLSPGMGWVPWWQSRVEPDFFDWWRQRTGLEVKGSKNRGYEAYVANGGDMVCVLVDTCRRYGMAPFVSLRLNDVHHQENYARANQESLVSCRFYTEHPEWHIDPDHPRHQGYYKKRGMDWAVSEVREYKLALLAELAANYELAGIELDFLRDDTLFRDDGPPEAERIELITTFVEAVRELLDRRGGPHRWLGVRIPVQLAAHARTGLDVQRLRAAGVDMFNLSGWYHTTQRTDIAAIRDRLPDAAIYLEMTHSTGWHPYFLKPGNYGTIGDVRTSVEQFYTAALLARERGADGLSLFNFVYYRMGYADGDLPVMEPPFHVLPKLNDPDFLRRQNRCYTIAGTSYFRQLPRELTAGTSTTLAMDMLPAAAGTTGRLRLHAEGELTAEHALTVHLNGQPLPPCADTTRFFGNPVDDMICPRRHRRAWTLPAAIIADGLNEIAVRLDRGPKVNLIYLDAGIPGNRSEAR